MVMLVAGNAYLLALADETQVPAWKRRLPLPKYRLTRRLPITRPGRAIAR